MEIGKIVYEIFINSIYLGNFLIFSLLVLFLYRRFVKFENKKEENLIGGVLIFSLSIAVSSLYSGESYGLLKDLIYIWFYSVLSVILLFVGHTITDKVLFYKVKNIEEIKGGNLSLLIVEIAHFISIGLVVNSLIDNYFSPNINQINLVIYILLIFLFIQFLVMLSVLAYIFILKNLKNVDLIELIYNNNLSGGILIFSNYIVISFLLVSAFSPEKDLLTTIIHSFLYFLFSLIVIFLIKILVDYILLPNETLEDILKEDRYMKAVFVELITLSLIFIYHFVSS